MLCLSFFLSFISFRSWGEFRLPESILPEFWVSLCSRTVIRLGPSLHNVKTTVVWFFIFVFRATNPSGSEILSVGEWASGGTVSFHNFKSQNFKLSVSNPKSKYVAYVSVLSRISNCQSLGRKNKHEILKTDRTPNLPTKIVDFRGFYSSIILI